jgi:hypothetical protein
MVKNKTREENDRGNYREIASLPILSKLFSGVLAGRLGEWPVHRRELSSLQAGFEKNKRRSDNILHNKNSSRQTPRGQERPHLLVFFDLEKTFGSVSREALWFKKHKKA